MIIELGDELCTTDHIMLCFCTVLTSMSWSLCWMKALYCWTCPAVWQYCTYQHVKTMVLDEELCTAEDILLCICNELTSMSWSLCWMMSTVLQNMTCCVSVLYLQACHDHCAGWQALYYWPRPTVQQYGTYHHVMIIVLDDKLFYEDHVLLCHSNVLTTMSWSLCWTAEHILLCVWERGELTCNTFIYWEETVGKGLQYTP